MRPRTTSSVISMEMRGSTTLRQTVTPSAMLGRVSAVAFDPEGARFVATGSLDGKGEVRVYDANTGAKVQCEKVTGPAYAAAWHPGGKVIASAGFDGVVWLHDAASGKLLSNFTVLPKK